MGNVFVIQNADRKFSHENSTHCNNNSGLHGQYLGFHHS